MAVSLPRPASRRLGSSSSELAVLEGRFPQAKRRGNSPQFYQCVTGSPEYGDAPLWLGYLLFGALLPDSDVVSGQP